MGNQNTLQFHNRDREILASNLSLTLDEFDKLVASANHAYEVIKEYGPFYGNEAVKEPTFRITAQPVSLPEGSKDQLTLLGNDLLQLAKVLPQLPEKYKKELGAEIDYRVPPTWRVDAIITEEQKLKVNEIEGLDSADALMIVEQIAYHLQTMDESTAAKLVPTLRAMCLPQKNDTYTIAFIRKVLPYNPHTANDYRIINFIDTVSQGTVHLDLLDKEQIKNGEIKPDWKSYAGVINQTSLSPAELLNFGIEDKQIISTGNYSALVNKMVMALVFEPALADFWNKHLGKERLERLQHIFIPTTIIRSHEDLQRAQEQGKVVKVAWANTNTTLINRSNGVVIPYGSDKHSDEDRWEAFTTYLDQKFSIIAQDFIIPARIHAFLRKKGTNLEPIEWYNRVCTKYVVEGNPNAIALPEVALTATEVTLGPEIVPAGRKCAFTAGKLR